MIVLLVVLLLVTGAPAQPPDTLWTRSFGTEGNDLFRAACLSGDSGYFLVGETSSGSYTDAWIVRTDAEGNDLWQATAGGSSWDRASSVARTTDGGCIVGGVTTSFGAGESDAWLIKMSAAGDTAWTHTYGTSGYDDLQSVKFTPDGGYVWTGGREQTGGYLTDMWLMKTDSVGETAWEIVIPGSSSNAYGTDVLSLMDGGFLAIGNKDTVIGDVGFFAPLAVRTDANGNILWQRYYAVDDEQWIIATVASVQNTPDGGFILAGTWDYANHGELLLWPDAFLLKIDEAGDPLWQSLCGVRYMDTASSVAVALDGGYLTAGYYVMGGSQHALFLSRTNTSGDTLWTKILPYPLGEGHAILAVGSGQFLVAGSTYSLENQNWDGWIVKLDSTHEVGVGPRGGSSPSEFRIAIFPNPFNSTTEFSFTLSHSGTVRLKVYDLLGQEVATVVDDRLSAGEHSVRFAAEDLSSGLYLARLETSEFSLTRKLVILK